VKHRKTGRRLSSLFVGFGNLPLTKNFRIERAGDEIIKGNIRTVHLVATPLGQAGYKFADLWVDNRGMVRLIKATGYDDDLTTIELYNIRKNTKVGIREFMMDLPGSTTRIEYKGIMTKYIRTPITVVTLGLLFGILSVSETNAQGILNTILTRMDAHYQALSSVKASIKLEKVNAQLGESDVSSGTIKFLPKKGGQQLYARIDWSKPYEESMAVIGEGYKLYRPRLQTGYLGKTSGAKTSGAAGGALVFMSMSKEQLKANYTIDYIGQEQITGAIQTWHLKLTPKTAASYKTSEIWVDGNGMPLQAKLTEKNDDTTTILLSDLQKNIRIPASEFTIDFPKGTKIVKG
jgi:outer membrane lipoprotein-sorting protein